MQLTQELKDLNGDLSVFKVQREQLATMDLQLLASEAINMVVLHDEADRNDAMLAFNMTYQRLRGNLVSGAMAIVELEGLKKA